MKVVLFCYGFGVAMLREWFYLAVLGLFVVAMLCLIWAIILEINHG